MKVVLTGGPSGGKTTLAQAIQKEFAQAVTVVPEAASIVFGGGWPRRKTPFGVRQQQKAIYFLQRELEELMFQERGDRLLVCDRGSLDGMAYWPREANEANGEGFLRAIGTTLDAEIARYDWVVHLNTAPASYYDLGNPLRNETFEEAWKLNERVKEAWAKHPRHIVIDNNENGHFFEKLARAMTVIQTIINGKGDTLLA